MARQALRLCEALLQSVAALDGAPQGLEGIALAGQRQQQLLPQQQQQQQQQHHKAHKYIEDIRSLTELHNNAWKKLLRERQVHGAPALESNTPGPRGPEGAKGLTNRAHFEEESD